LILFNNCNNNYKLILKTKKKKKWKKKVLLIFFSSYLNQLGTENWSKFAAKNYFDEEGKFMLLFLNIPVFIELGLCLVSIIYIYIYTYFFLNNFKYLLIK